MLKMRQMFGPQHFGSSFSCSWFRRHASCASNYYHVCIFVDHCLEIKRTPILQYRLHSMTQLTSIILCQFVNTNIIIDCQKMCSPAQGKLCSNKLWWTINQSKSWLETLHSSTMYGHLYNIEYYENEEKFNFFSFSWHSI